MMLLEQLSKRMRAYGAPAPTTVVTHEWVHDLASLPSVTDDPGFVKDLIAFVFDECTTRTRGGTGFCWADVIARGGPAALVQHFDKLSAAYLEHASEGHPSERWCPEERPDDFERFLGVYPRRSGRTAAAKAWMAATRRASPAEIIAGAQRYRDDPNREPQFTAHPANWLKDGRWMDDPLPARKSTNPLRGRHRDSLVDVAHRAYAEEPQRRPVARRPEIAGARPSLLAGLAEGAA
jgi:hypothetical protein